MAFRWWADNDLKSMLSCSMHTKSMKDALNNHGNRTVKLHLLRVDVGLEDRAKVKFTYTIKHIHVT